MTQSNATAAGAAQLFMLAWLALLPLPGQTEKPFIQNPYQRPGLDLNGDWRVIPDPYENGYYNYRYQPRADGYFLARQPNSPSDLVEYDFEASQVLQVPGDWNSQDPRYFFYEGTIWYYRAFDIQLKDNHRYVLHFGAVNYAASVWLNGQELGHHEGGFTPFQFDVGARLVPGKNFVVVKVDNRRESDQVPTVNTDWWNYGGITRPVRLLELPAEHVVDYRFELTRTGSVSGRVLLSRGLATVGIDIPELSVAAQLQTDDAGQASFEFDVRPQRWSPESPHLYDVALRVGDTVVHDRIGFRSIATRGEDILLNGESIFLRGISIHEESPLRPGRAWSEADARELLERARALGCNFVRLAHYPHNEAMVRMADEMGLLVWAEIPVYWTIDFSSPEVFENARRQLGEMIARDANRASIILWSMANETPLGQPRLEFISGLAAHAREMDDTRLITAAMDTQSAEEHQFVIDDPLSDVIDVIGINSYCGWYGGTPQECARWRWRSESGKPIIISELGAGALKGLRGAINERWTEDYQAEVYRRNLQMVDHIDALRGLSPWILQDFRSPRRPLPNIQDFWNRKGLLSESGEPKKAWFVLNDYYEKRRTARAK